MGIRTGFALREFLVRQGCLPNHAMRRKELLSCKYFCGDNADNLLEIFNANDRLYGFGGNDTLRRLESLRFGSISLTEVTNLQSLNIEELVSLNRDGVATKVLADIYSGQVAWLQYQLLGSAGGDVAVGTSRNDFFNLLGGDDAANGAAGDDVLDGGTGSSSLTSGAGRDDFFLDGRGGTVTWATITDWQAGERLSVWGWRPGVSKVLWVADAGAQGYTGVTMHGDLDGNGEIDTSVTWTGLTAAQLPTPLEYDGLLCFT
ncbi:MAG: calcium-binding protein [Roseomonas sp.]|nr:calcium-binding protein [Roseomonas sp.]